jgi:hypothetical protein
MDLNKAFRIPGSQPFQENNVQASLFAVTAECLVETNNVGTECESGLFDLEKMINERSANAAGSIYEGLTFSNENGINELNMIGVTTKSSSPRDSPSSNKLQSRLFGQELSNKLPTPAKRKNTAAATTTTKRKLNDENKENPNQFEIKTIGEEAEAGNVSKKRRHAVDSPSYVYPKEDDQVSLISNLKLYFIL